MRLGEPKMNDGMNRNLSLIVLLGMANFAPAEILFNQGNVVNSPGGGFNGGDLSRDFTGGQTGFASYFVNPGPHFRMADDFTVSSPGWQVTGVSVFGYSTSSAYGPIPASAITGVSVRIWSGRPGDAEANIIAISTAIGENVWTGAYRVSSSAAATDATRPVFRTRADFTDLELQPGDYWMDYQLTCLGPSGSTTGFTPQVMNPDLPASSPDGNGRQLNSAGWVNLVGGPQSQALAVPFIIHGSELVTQTLSGNLVLNDTVNTFATPRNIAYSVHLGTEVLASGSVIATGPTTPFEIRVPILGPTYVEIDWQGGTFLTRKIGVSLTDTNQSINTVSLVNGDTDGTNEIGLNDIDVAISNYGSSEPSCDVNASGEVGLADLDVIINNYGMGGD